MKARQQTELHVIPAATRGELLAAMTCGIFIAQQRQLDLTPPPQTTIDSDCLTILTADMLGRPIEAVQLVEQVGRFAHVRYKPLAHPDPDIMLALIPSAHHFHQAVRDFQAMRRTAYNWSEWYADMKAQARELIPPLLRLQPHPAEADFVIRWALLVCAQGRTL